MNDSFDDDWEKRWKNSLYDIFNKNILVFPENDGEKDKLVSIIKEIRMHCIVFLKIIFFYDISEV